MLVMNNGLIYLTGRKTEAGGKRKLQFFQVKWELPDAMFDSQDHTLKAVFDGELCEDKYVNFEKYKKTVQSVKYMIFDCLYANESLQTQENYHFRLKHAEGFLKLKETVSQLNLKNFYEPCEQLIRFREVVENYQKILVVLKDFYYFQQATEYLFRNYIPCLPHKNDGLIFTQINAQYKPGTMQEIIKWKPPHMNSIDFTIKINYERQNQFVLEAYLLGPGNQLLFVDFLVVNEQKYQEFRGIQEREQVSGVVTECNFTEISMDDQQLLEELRNELSGQNFSECIQELNHKDQKFYVQMQEQLKNLIKKNRQKGWNLDKYRVDKSQPNYFTVGLNILECLQENITEEKLIEESKDAARLLFIREQQEQQQYLLQQQQQYEQQNQQQGQQDENLRGQDPYKKQKRQ
ncbi:Nucleic acid-binding, OB-fold [Pseudocohnilembus persalinus]|uniref:mRNA guanylyltransferase n=1 Tax=Pseudocohnilembus persalinus TaxID=266149 RepID=A0A0V0QPM0_PSEPJ|nr:Nucleic acid-binding, OB-fold [Pseudocohnilembus persalinus]|eukprot:KRX04109.1 Nucleic acid-binding, OB-fold [Pseudocohnilembus persalinus]